VLRDRCPVCPVSDVGVLWINGWMDQDATWYGGRPRSRRHCVRWGPSLPPSKKGRAPNFRLMSVVVKRLDRSRCHLVGGPSNILLDGDPAPPPKWRDTALPVFSLCLLWPNVWMDQDASWYRPHCIRWGRSFHPKAAQQPPPSLRPMSIVAKRLPMSATTEALRGPGAPLSPLFSLVLSLPHRLLFFTFPLFLFSFALPIFFFCPSVPLFLPE